MNQKVVEPIKCVQEALVLLKFIDTHNTYEESEMGLDAQREEFRTRDVEVNDSIDDRPDLEEEN